MTDQVLCLLAPAPQLSWMSDSMEKRGEARYLFGLVARGYLTFGEDRFRLTVWPVNISLTGIAFHVNWPFDPGCGLTIHLVKPGGDTIKLCAKVIHSTRHDKRGWLIGCEFFERLDARTLEDLI